MTNYVNVITFLCHNYFHKLLRFKRYLKQANIQINSNIRHKHNFYCNSNVI